jgi:hypothetical protein
VIPTKSSLAKNAASGIIIVDIAEQRDADQTIAPQKKNQKQQQQQQQPPPPSPQNAVNL